MASEAAQRKAKELGVDIESVTGTGANGNVLVSDVEKAAAKPAKPAKESGELIALVNIPGSMVGARRRVERGDTFTTDDARAKNLLRIRYAKRA